jgi:hypothetical protein
MCAIDMRPEMFMEGKGFLNFAQNLINIGATFGCINVTHVLPRRTTVSNHVSSVYSSLKEKFIEKIQRFGVTFDGWLHEYTGASYITITLHYISEEKNKWKINNFVLSTREMCENKNASNIK